MQHRRQGTCRGTPLPEFVTKLEPRSTTSMFLRSLHSNNLTQLCVIPASLYCPREHVRARHCLEVAPCAKPSPFGHSAEHLASISALTHAHYLAPHRIWSPCQVPPWTDT
ncbi:hypothetical protein PVAP13_3NG248141 [Panicum virgatum]|uniref:Uncharacterized protein n=1 Tax=Panicum virgatum TaxID=38727 RepID=A0A8T0UJR5_PANVG|nr:hypothetical protein PVAP13_3NG248141 [Panicum virgatum]